MEAVAEVVVRAITGGVDWIQIREKDMAAGELHTLVARAVAASGAQTRIIVNDRLDVALAAGAAGVHLGGRSIPVGEARRWCRANHATRWLLIGASCHSLQEAQAAEQDGADYVFFGPVFPTPSKVSFGAPQGTTRLEEVCHGVRLPVLAIGGITVKNAAECIRAGAAGIAAIRLFQEAREIAAAVAELRSRLAIGPAQPPKNVLS